MSTTQKPKLLYVGEASFLNTGFSVYSKAIMSRLVESALFEVAELGCYATPDDPRQHELPWKFFGNQPPKSDWERLGYNPDSTHQFGDWRFNEILLQYKPDIVWDIRDHWMLEYEGLSPFRRHFHWVIMPTVDARPQAEHWISTYMTADAVLTYSDWGKNILDGQSNGRINTVGSAPPAADKEIFRPMDRAMVRKKFGFEEDILIVGTIMRNQPRKLYPQLIKDFADFVRLAPWEIAKRSYLYIHTSYPDREGWDLPYLIKQSGIAHKILVTYRCLSCHTVFSSFFQDAKTTCVKCGSPTATTPNSANGIDQSSLAHIINLFDIYVQYANSEGFGLPQVEAAYCGVPVMATDYSAMSDVVRKLGGDPIQVAALEVEHGSNCLRARPDGKDFISLLINYLSLPEDSRTAARERVGALALTHYDWDKTAQRWIDTFLPLGCAASRHASEARSGLYPPASRHAGRRPAVGEANSKARWVRPKAPWDSPPRLHQPVLPSKSYESNADFVVHCVAHVLGRPEMTNSYFAMQLIKDLNRGYTTRGVAKGIRPFGTEDVVNELLHICEHFNNWERKRCDHGN